MILCHTLSPSFTEKHVSHCMPTATKSGACVAGGCQLTAWQHAKVSISSAQRYIRYTNGHQHTACVNMCQLCLPATRDNQTTGNIQSRMAVSTLKVGLLLLYCSYMFLPFLYRSCCQCLVGSRGLGGDQEGWTWKPNGTHQTCILLRYALPRSSKGVFRKWIHCM